MRAERDGAGAFAPGRADWEQGELAGLDRYQDRLWGNRDRAKTGRDGRTSGWGLGGQDWERGREAPGECGERSGTQPEREVAVGSGLGGARRGDRAGMRDRDTGLREGLWKGCGVGDDGRLIPHDAQPASLAGGSTIPWGRSSATPLKGRETRKTGAIQLVVGVWDSASSPVTKLGPGARRVAKL